MANMGRYCKAYYAKQLSEFAGWHPDLRQLLPHISEVDGEEVQRARTELEAEDILYVQENYAVTDGIFLDQNILFNPGTAEWEEFCRKVLRFEVPAELMPTPQAEASVSAQAAS